MPKGGQKAAKGRPGEARGRPEGGQERPRRPSQARRRNQARATGSEATDIGADWRFRSRGVRIFRNPFGQPRPDRRGQAKRPSGFWGSEGFTPLLRMGLPVDPGLSTLTVSSVPFGAPKAFQERSKNPSMFQSNFQPRLVACWLPKCIPKPSKITETSSQNRTWQTKT